MEAMDATVVVVDDERDILDLVCSVLQDEGYVVICLTHPVAIGDVKTHEPQPHLFLLDIMFPAMSGIELARQ
jgi:two-component system, OmpR family, response regulator CssR